MIRLSNSNASLIQGLIATKGLKAQGFFRKLRISGRRRRRKEKKNTSTAVFIWLFNYKMKLNQDLVTYSAFPAIV